MTTQHKENNLSKEAVDVSPHVKISIKNRPNIDHLIKRILTERRKTNKKNIFAFIVIFLLVGGLSIYSLYN
jgi:hypothetical protein|tara:strand:- start:253 stop:465 length:213 start_codon:yes stop_codon:yes gene_type:complete